LGEDQPDIILGDVQGFGASIVDSQMGRDLVFYRIYTDQPVRDRFSTKPVIEENQRMQARF
jgi:hypothetical protein